MSFLKNKLILLLVFILIASISFSSISVSAANESLIKTVEEAISQINVSNTTIANDVATNLKSKLGTDYTVTVGDWYLSRAVGACRDSSGVLFDGYDGFVSGTANVTYNNETVSLPFKITIKPTMVTYKFDSEAKCNYFYPDPDTGGKYLRGDIEGRPGEYFLLSDNGKTFFGYSGEAEKIIIPEGVTTLNQSWWLDTNLDNVRCIILPDSLEVLPDQFGVPFVNSLEVVVMGDNVTWAEGYHTFWRCFHLKHLRLSDNLENLPEEALFETISLTEVKLPSKLKIIGKGAFHLSSLRNITVPESVTEIGQEAFAWPVRKAQYLAVGVRTQGNAIATEITTEVDNYLKNRLFDSSGEIIPRIVTVMSKKAIYDELILNFWQSDFSWSTIDIRYHKGSTTEALMNGGYTPKSTTYYLLEMAEGEVKGRIESAVSTISINKKTTAKDIEEYISKQVYSKNLKKITVKDYKYKAATSKKNGSAKATVVVEYGENTFNVKLDRVLKYFAPYKTGEEPLEDVSSSVSDKVENDYLDVEFITNKEDYKTGEEIKVSLKIGNKIGKELPNIKVEFDKDVLSLKKGSLTPVNFNLAAAGDKEVNLVLAKPIADENIPSVDKVSSETSTESDVTSSNNSQVSSDDISSEDTSSENDSDFEDDESENESSMDEETDSSDENDYYEDDSDSEDIYSSEDTSSEELESSDNAESSENEEGIVSDDETNDNSSETASNSSNKGNKKENSNLLWIIIVIVICLLCVAGIVILYIRKVKHRKILSVILSFIMCISVFSFTILPTTASSERITVRKRITVDGDRYTISATITFNAPDEIESDMDNNYTVNWNINE